MMMDKQQIQAYANLIAQLMWCADPEEAKEMMQQNPQLINPALLAAISSDIDHTQSRGNAKAVRRLQQLQQMTADWIALHPAPSLGLAEGSTTSESSGDAAEFVEEILQLIVQTQGDQAQAHGFFSANIGRLGEALLIALPKVFANLIQQSDSYAVATLFVEFGDLIQKFPLGNRMLNLEISIAAYEQALQYLTHDAFPLNWATTQNSLANAYKNRIQGKRSDNIEQAIATYEKALQVLTRDIFPENWAITQNNLANSYSIRIQGERAENLEKSIEIHNLVLQFRTLNSPSEQWATTQFNLASAYSDRIRGDHSENVEKAISYYEVAREFFEREKLLEKLALVQGNLANSYNKRVQGDRSENIEKSIEFHEFSLQFFTYELFPERWANIQNNLSSVYLERHRGEHSWNIEKAINLSKSSLSVYTRDSFPDQWALAKNNLANAYSDRIEGNRIESLRQAIDAYECALQVHTCHSFPKECRKTARNLGNLHFQANQWSEAVGAYVLSFTAAESLYQSSTLLSGKLDELRNAADLFPRLAYSQSKQEHLHSACTTLEQSRARGLSESLDRDRTNLDNLKTQNEPLHSQYKNITQQLRNLEAQQRDRMTSADRNSITPEILRNEATRLRQELTETIDRIRQQPGYEAFLSLPTYEDVQKAVTPQNPLTYLLTTPAGSLALVVTPDNIHPIWLNDLTDTHLTDLLQAWFVPYETFKNKQTPENCQTWHKTIDQTTQQLWEPIIGPMVEQIQALGFDRITLIPTGYLSLLPLHAAWTPDNTKPTGRRYALDDIHITYSPNAKSLTAAQAIVQSLNDRGQADTILAIDEPHHRILDSKTGEYKPVSPLPSSSQEVKSAIATFQTSRILQHNQATREAVLDALPHATILHCSCHGNANLQEPLKSGLAMTGDGEAATLTLKDLLALKLSEGNRPGLRLAILSACETGLPGLDNIDEVVSLPIGLMQAGVAGVISSLWSVSDLSTMLLLTKFYDLWRKHNLAPDQALRQAQQWLRDSTEREIAPLLGQRTRTADHRPFAHPYYWSAFSYTGL